MDKSELLALLQEHMEIDGCVTIDGDMIQVIQVQIRFDGEIIDTATFPNEVTYD